MFDEALEANSVTVLLILLNITLDRGIKAQNRYIVFLNTINETFRNISGMSLKLTDLSLFSNSTNQE